jgi:predicted CXXCH cytochrome family protein
MSCADCQLTRNVGLAVKGGEQMFSNQFGAVASLFSVRTRTCFQCTPRSAIVLYMSAEALRQGGVVCHSPHGSVNQRMLNTRNQTLCLQVSSPQQTEPGHIFIGDVDQQQLPPAGNLLVGWMS